MSRLTESYVRDAAIQKLIDHYQLRPDVQATVGRKEARVSPRSKLGSGRADGLIAAMMLDGSIHTASIEAKSSKTFLNILPFYQDEKWLLHGILAGLVGLVLAEIVGQLVGGWFMVWVFPPLVFVAVGFAYLGRTSSGYHSIGVIAQVKRYPANDRWIAISTDAYNQLGAEGEALHRDCHKYGIGLMLISSGARAKFKSYPTPRTLPKGYHDFLVCYAAENLMRYELQGQLQAAVPLTAQTEPGE